MKKKKTPDDQGAKKKRIVGVSQTPTILRPKDIEEAVVERTIAAIDKE